MIALIYAKENGFIKVLKLLILEGAPSEDLSWQQITIYYATDMLKHGKPILLLLCSHIFDMSRRRVPVLKSF